MFIGTFCLIFVWCLFFVCYDWLAVCLTDGIIGSTTARYRLPMTGAYGRHGIKVRDTWQSCAVVKMRGRVLATGSAVYSRSQLVAPMTGGQRNGAVPWDHEVANSACHEPFHTNLARLLWGRFDVSEVSPFKRCKALARSSHRNACARRGNV
jgi:hypothetical protein